MRQNDCRDPYINYLCTICNSHSIHKFTNLYLFQTHCLWSKRVSIYYTCQLSCIMRESHACGLKTSISNIEDNFSGLTHKYGRVVLKKLHFISDLLCIISLLFITIAKAFKCLKSVQIVSVQRSSEYLLTFSVTFGSLWKIVGNLQKWLGRFRKFRS